MSAEIIVTIVLTGITGLCILLWNTDGSLDWISYAAGLVASLLSFLAVVWNSACSTLAFVGSAAAGQSGPAVQAAIARHAWDEKVPMGLTAIFILLTLLPNIIAAARRARR